MPLRTSSVSSSARSACAIAVVRVLAPRGRPELPGPKRPLSSLSSVSGRILRLSSFMVFLHKRLDDGAIDRSGCTIRQRAPPFDPRRGRTGGWSGPLTRAVADRLNLAREQPSSEAIYSVERIAAEDRERRPFPPAPPALQRPWRDADLLGELMLAEIVGEQAGGGVGHGAFQQKRPASAGPQTNSKDGGVTLVRPDRPWP
jgi:hypothetical protein